MDEDLGISLLQDMLGALIKASEGEHPYLAVMVSFARHFAEDIAGVTPRKSRVLFSKFKMKPRLAQVCVCVCMCACACMRACMCVHACVSTWFSMVEESLWS